MDSTATIAECEIHLPMAIVSKGMSEYRAFKQLLPKLLANYRGKYVAVHEGRVIDSDPDDIALVKLTHDKIG